MRALVSGTRGLVFQDFAMTEMEYVGPPVIFKLTEHERERGTAAPKSVVWYGSRVYYYSHDGFYYYDFLERKSEQIGQDRVDATFEALCPGNRVRDMLGAIDARRGLVFWAFSSITSENTNEANYDHIIVYNWVVDRWSLVRLNVSYLAQVVSGGVTLEDLDTESEYHDSATGRASLDVAGALSLDSDIWRSGALSFIGFDAAHKAGTFTGNVLPARLESRETAGRDNHLRYVQSVRPLLKTWILRSSR